MGSVLAILTYLDRVCIAVAGPRMQDGLHISPEAWGWVTSAFFLSYSLFEIPTGVLGDRTGPRKVLTRVVLWWSVFTSLTGVVSSYGVLLSVRFLFGAGEAGAYPNLSIVLARWLPAGKRGRGWGVIFSASQLGGALAPLLVVPIQQAYGWRASFWVFGILGVGWAAAWYWWFRDSPAGKPGVSQEELVEIGENAPSKHSVAWGKAVRSGGMWQLAGIGASYLYTMSFFWSWLQTYLVRGRGYTEGGLMLSSLPYLLGAAAAGCGGMISDGLVRRFGLRAGRRGLGMFGLGTAALFLAATVVTRSNGLALVFLSLAYTGILLQQPNVGAVVLDKGRRNAGAVFAFLNTAGNAASALSSVAFGYLATYFHNYDAPFVPMVAALCLGVWLWLRVDPTVELELDDVKG